MRLNQTTDHAIRILLVLANTKTVTTSSALADKTGLSRRNLFQIMPRLRDAGMISVTKGAEGGYALGIAPADLSIHDVIQLMEGPIQLPDRGGWQRSIDPLDAAYGVFKDFFEGSTRRISFDKLISCSYKEIQQHILEYAARAKTELY